MAPAAAKVPTSPHVLPAGYGLIGLACLCVTACSLYWLLRLAPPAAPLTDAEGGWKWAGARLAAALLFVPRVLLWHPTWSVALLWAAAAGERCQCREAAARRGGWFLACCHTTGELRRLRSGPPSGPRLLWPLQGAGVAWSAPRTMRSSSGALRLWCPPACLPWASWPHGTRCCGAPAAADGARC